jgi:hypothetical protein
MQNIVAGGEIPYREALRELDHGIRKPGGDVAEADGAKVNTDASSCLSFTG